VDLKWLEDFLILAELRNFTQAAEARYVTQPAFSRRIKALEAWVGTPLIDRSTYPVALTPAGEDFLEVVREYVSGLLRSRTDLRERFAEHESVLVWIMPGSLSATFFPGWWRRFSPLLPSLRIKIIAQKLLDASHSLELGAGHLMLFYRHAAMPPSLEPDRFESIEVGVEQLVPVSAPDDYGRARFSLDDAGDVPIPFITPGQDTIISRIVDQIVERNGSVVSFDTVYENANADSLRTEVVAGRGLARLPSRLVQAQLGSGALVAAGDVAWEEPLGIWMYRAIKAHHPAVPKLWQAIIDERNEDYSESASSE